MKSDFFCWQNGIFGWKITMPEHDWETIISALSKHIANLISFVFSASNLAVFEHPILGYMKLRRQGYYWGMGGQMGQQGGHCIGWWVSWFDQWCSLKGKKGKTFPGILIAVWGDTLRRFEPSKASGAGQGQCPWSLRSTGAFPLKLLQAPLLGAGLKLDSKGNHRTDSAIVWPLKTTKLFMMNNAAPSLFILCWQPTYLSTKHRTLIVAS